MKLKSGVLKKIIFLQVILLLIPVTVSSDIPMGVPDPETVLIIRLAGSGFRDELYTNIRDSIIAAGGIVTPLAKDLAKEYAIRIVRAGSR